MALLTFARLIIEQDTQIVCSKFSLYWWFSSI